MAKKRLNKKVVLIGSGIFVFLVLAGIGVILRLSRDPEKFIKDGDAAMKAAVEVINEEIKAEEYEKAERNYQKAYAQAKTDSLKIEMLFKLADIYLKTDKWNNVLGCWNKIIRIDPKNVKARFGRLKYVNILADSGARRVWQEVASQASEFIEVTDTNLLAEDTAKWESFGEERQTSAKRMGPYLYLARGRALLEITRMGAVTDPDESLARAIDDLEKVRELEPSNIDAYWYLAQAIITKGEILAEKGNLEERDKAAEQAKELLEQAVETAGADPRAHINLLTIKLALAQMSREQIQFLEPEYLSFVDKYSSSAQAHSALSAFYQQLGHQNLDEAIEAIEKAIGLDRENVSYAIRAANLHYRKFSIYGQEEEIHKAVEIAKGALTLPNAQDKPGPRRWVNRINRTSLYIFLANCYIEQVLDPSLRGDGSVSSVEAAEECLTNAEQAVHQIEQLLGSGEEPEVVKWQGMLELAKSELGKEDKNIAIKKLYATYEQLKASGRRDAQLSYALAKFFENTAELGAVAEFFASALSIYDRSVPNKIDETKPEAFLDYANVLLQLRIYGGVLSVVKFFENEYWANQKSQTLRINALIGAKQFDEAEEELAILEPDDPDAIKLNLLLMQAKIRQLRRAIRRKQTEDSSEGLPSAEKEGVEDVEELMTTELKGYNNALAELVEKLLSVEPNSVVEGFIAAVCNNYIREGKTGEAGDLVNRYLEHFPDNTMVLLYKQVLSEPEPAKLIEPGQDKISQQRRKEIEGQVLSSIADPIRRAIGLGGFYQRNNEPNKAAIEFKKVLGSRLRGDDDAVPVRDEEITDLQRLAASYLFDIALGAKDWEMAEQIAAIARRENIDDCEGNIFAARLAVAKEEYKDALARLEECLRQRPVFSYAYMLRSRVNAALGNEHSSIEDAQKAVSLNPLEGNIARRLAVALYQRNRRLGNNVSADQMIEAKDALIKAISLNPTEWQLQSFYAEYISAENPENALAIRQRLQKAVPSVGNALLLGRMAIKMALREANAERKAVLFAIAASSLEQASTIDPQNKAVLNAQAEYYRITGQADMAEKLLAQSQDKMLLYGHYLRIGRFAEAKRIVEELYKADSKDPTVVKGLLLVAERTADKEAAKKYTEELLSLEDNVENHLFQIQTFLKIGLVKEAEYKLQSFKEKFSDEPRALLLEAWLAMKQGQLKRALELTNRNLETNQDNAVAWQLRGQINRLMANYDQAISDLKRSNSLSEEPTTRIALARAYLRAGREEDAITELKSTVDSPGGGQALMEGRRLLEQVYWWLGKKIALKTFYDKTLVKLPDSVYWHNRAGAFAIAVGDVSGAEQLYKRAWQKAEQHGSGNATALDGYLHTLLLGGKLDKIFEEAGKYVDSDFAPIAFFKMAEAKLKLGDRAVAIEYCRKAVDKAGTSEEFALNILQRMYSLLGEEEVLRYCKEKLEANPDSLAANFAMYNLTKINGEYNKAVDYVDKCLQIVGSDSRRKIDYIMKKTRVLELAYKKTSDNNYLKKAIVEYESLLAEVPNNTDVLNNLAYQMAEGNVRLAEALQYAKRAYEARPNNPGFLDTYAYVLYKNDKFPEAAEFLQSALQQYEQDKISAPAEVYEHLGMIKEELGTKTEALAAYEQALETGADELSEAAIERIKKAIERLLK